MPYTSRPAELCANGEHADAVLSFIESMRAQCLPASAGGGPTELDWWNMWDMAETARLDRRVPGDGQDARNGMQHACQA